MLPEAVLSNDILERAALIDPVSPEELRDIKGFGPEKFALYAGGIVDALRPKKR